MELYYQPKIFLRSGRLAGAEALIRWQSPRDGTLLPSYFMPALENTQAIHALFWFVLNSALRCAADWVERIPDFTIAVNVAPDNLEDPDLRRNRCKRSADLEFSGPAAAFRDYRNDRYARYRRKSGDVE